jgi:hypothetical protein
MIAPGRSTCLRCCKGEYICQLCRLECKVLPTTVESRQLSGRPLLPPRIRMLLVDKAARGLEWLDLKVPAVFPKGAFRRPGVDLRLFYVNSPLYCTTLH